MRFEKIIKFVGDDWLEGREIKGEENTELDRWRPINVKFIQFIVLFKKFYFW